MNKYDFYKDFFGSGVNTSTVVLRVESLADSDSVNDVVINMIAVSEGFAALVKKSNPLSSVGAESLALGDNMYELRTKIESGEKVPHSLLVKIESNILGISSAAALGIGAVLSSPIWGLAGMLAGVAGVVLSVYALANPDEEIPAGFQESVKELLVESLSVVDDFLSGISYIFSEYTLDNGVVLDSSMEYVFEFLSAHTNIGRDVDGVRIINDIIDSSSFDMFDKAGPEKFLNDLSDVFGVDKVGLNTSIEYAVQILTINKKIYDALGKDGYENIKFDIKSLVGLSGSDIVSLMGLGAREEKAIKFALLNQSAFILIGDGLYEGFDPNVVERQFLDDESMNFWIDRADFLALYIKNNLNDGGGLTGSVNLPELESDTWYRDFVTTASVTNYWGLADRNSSAERIWFASESGGEMKGAKGSDHLYGNTGSDILLGHEEADQLYGGDGNDALFANNYENRSDGAVDRLYGGKGDDVYFLSSGDVTKDSEGYDVYVVNTREATGEAVIIEDQDRNGQLIVNDYALRFGLFDSENNWSAIAPFISFSMAGTSLIISDSEGDNIEIKNFTNGDFGIRLEEKDSAPPTVSSDTVSAGGNHQYFGSEGDDHIINDGSGCWEIYGMGGDDLIEGADHIDFIFGGEGADQIIGGGSPDRLAGGAGSDQIQGGEGDDWVSADGHYFTASPDLYGQELDGNILAGDEGADIIFGAKGDDQLFAGSKDSLSSVLNSDQTVAVAGMEFLSAGDGDDLLVGANSSDYMFGGAGNDVLVGGAGDDFIYGDADVRTGAANWDIKVSLDDASYILSAADDHTDLTVAGDDTIHAGGGNDIVSGGKGNDVLYGDAGSDRLFGGDGNDYLADDQGINRLEGGEGNDIYVVDNPTGFSTIVDDAYSDDTYSVAGDASITDDSGSDLYNIIGSGNIVVTDKDGRDNYTLKSEGAVRIVDQFGTDRYMISGATGNYQIADADALLDSILLDGFSSVDAFFAVDDSKTEWRNLSNTLLLKTGAETVLTSIEGSAVHLEGFRERDFGIKLFDAQRDTSSSQVSDALLGSVLSGAATLGTDGANTIYGSSANNLLVGFAGNDTLYGDSSDDTVDGGAGDDSLSGGSGNDRVFGGDGSDRINGGTGSDLLYGYSDLKPTLDSDGGTSADYLEGGAGSDVLIGSKGEDQLYASEYSSYLNGSYEDDGTLNTDRNFLNGGQGDDILVGDAGDDVLFGGAGSDTLRGGAGNDILSGIADVRVYDTGWEIYMPYEYSTDFRIKTKYDSFTDEYENGSDILYGGLGNDYLLGGNGNSTMFGGEGDDLLYNGHGGDNYLYGGVGDDYYVTLRSSGVNVIEDVEGSDYYNISETVQYGYAWWSRKNLPLYDYENARIYINDFFGDDSYDISGEAHVEINDSGDGLDEYYISATQGYDGYAPIFRTTLNVPSVVIDDSNAHYDLLYIKGPNRGTEARGDTFFIRDSSQEGVFRSIQGDMRISLNEQGIVLYKEIDISPNQFGVHFIRDIEIFLPSFTNGDFGIRLLDDKYLQKYFENDSNDLVMETDVSGWYLSNVDDGENYVNGSQLSGSLTAWGEEGNDVLVGGDQLDIIYGGGGTDQIYGGAGRDLLFGDSGLLSDTDAASDYIVGGEGDDIIQGGGGDDHIFVGSENDFESAMNETQASTSSMNFANGGAGGDTIVGGGGTDLIMGASGDDLILGGAGNDYIFGDADFRTIDLDWKFNSGFYNERTFSYRYNRIVDYSSPSASGADLLYGGSGDDIIDGGGGDDRIFGGSGSDWLIGGLGDDVLSSGSGNDSLYGEEGDDILKGSVGNDKYIFGEYYSVGEIGFDIVEDTGGLYDKININTRTRLSDIKFSQKSNDLVVEISSKDGITIKDWFVSDQYKIETFFFGRERISLDIRSIQDRTSYTSLLVTESIDDQVIEHGREFSLTLPSNTFSGPSPETRTITATLSDGNPLPAWLVFDPSTNTFSGVADVSGGAALDIVVTATNELGQSVSDQFNLDIEVTNLPPSVAFPLQDMDTEEDQVFSFTVPEGTFYDPDLGVGDSLSLEATLVNGDTLPAWLKFDPLTATFSGIPENDHVGALEVRVTTSDSYGETADDTFVLTVQNVNDTPLLNSIIADQFILEDQVFTLELEAGMFSDPDIIHGDSLSITATLKDGEPLPTWLSFDESTRTLSGTPTNNDVGNLSVILTATDLSGASASDEFDIQIQNVNDAPRIVRSIANQQALEDQAFMLDVGNVFDDDDRIHGDYLTLSARLENGEALPPWLAFDVVTGMFTGEPTNNDVGFYSVMVIATDVSGESVSDPFTLEVVNVNDAPVLVLPLQDNVAVQGEPYEYVIPPQTFTDDDLINGDSLYLSATLLDGSPLPDWLSFDPITQTFSGTPNEVDTGLLSINVTATDSEGVAVSSGYAILVQGLSKVNQTGSKHHDVITGSIVGDQLVGLGSDDVMYGGAGDDVLKGVDGNDVLYGGDGRDTLKGGHGDDVMYGGDGDDILGGGHGHDTHIGGAGNDYSEDVGGYDKYIFGYGDGHDVINDKGGVDQLQFTAGVNPHDLWFSRQGDDLTVSFLDSNDQVTINNWYKAPSTAQIETIEAGNGSVLMNSQVEQLVQAMAVYDDPVSGDFRPSQAMRDEVSELIVASWRSV